MRYGSVCSGIEAASVGITGMVRDITGHRNGRLVAVDHCYRTRHSWAKAVIRHYGNKCQRCGWDEARCDAHHRTPKAEGGLHTIKNGIVLCPNCHRIHHEKGGVIK